MEPDTVAAVGGAVADSETWLTLSRIGLSALIIPLVAVLKKFTPIFDWLIDETHFKLFVMFLLMFGLSIAFETGLSADVIFDKACAMLGLSALFYRSGKRARKVRGARRTNPKIP